MYGPMTDLDGLGTCIGQTRCSPEVSVESRFTYTDEDGDVVSPSQLDALTVMTRSVPTNVNMFVFNSTFHGGLIGRVSYHGYWGKRSLDIQIPSGIEDGGQRWVNLTESRTKFFTGLHVIPSSVAVSQHATALHILFRNDTLWLEVAPKNIATSCFTASRDTGNSLPILIDPNGGDAYDAFFTKCTSDRYTVLRPQVSLSFSLSAFLLCVYVCVCTRVRMQLSLMVS